MKFFIYLLGFLFMASVSPLQSESLKFIPCTDQRLRQVSEKVTKEELKSDDIQLLIQKMLVLAGFESNPTATGQKTTMVGLAAPQIGVMKQIIIIDTQKHMSKKKGRNQPNFDVLINPEIVWSSDQTNAIPQGCYSVPDELLGVVERASAVVVKALDLNGETIHKRYEDYPAHVVQHEIDHLNGIRFPERVLSASHLHIFPNGKRDIPKYSKNWKSWPHHVDQETFIQLIEKDYSQLSL